jgi:hypothetical protein
MITPHQLLLEDQGLPPEQNLKVLRDKEHEPAALQRLAKGDDSCGCEICQAVQKRSGLVKTVLRHPPIKENPPVVKRTAPRKGMKVSKGEKMHRRGK